MAALTGGGYSGAWLKLEGLEETRQEFAAYQANALSLANVTVSLGSPLPYAWGIETGFHRGGGLARRAGGVFYLQAGLQAGVDFFAGRLASAVLSGSTGLSINELVSQTQRAMLQAAQATVVVRSGQLRGSIVAQRSGSLR